MPHLGSPGCSLAEVKLSDRACPMVRRHITVGLLAKQVLHRGRGETISQALVLDSMLAPAGNQLAVANQADRAVTLDREPLDRLGLGRLSGLAAAGLSRRHLSRAGLPGTRDRESRRKASNSAGPR